MTDYKLVPVERCAACGNKKPASEMKICMHRQMHRYVCDSKCMNDYYNPPKNPRSDAAAPAVQGEPVGYGVLSAISKKWDGRTFVPKDEADGYDDSALLPLYASPQPAPDVAGLIVLLEHAQCPNCDGSGARHDNYGEPEQCQWCHERAEALAAHRNQGGDAL